MKENNNPVLVVGGLILVASVAGLAFKADVLAWWSGVLPVIMANLWATLPVVGILYVFSLFVLLFLLVTDTGFIPALRFLAGIFSVFAFVCLIPYLIFYKSFNPPVFIFFLVMGSCLILWGLARAFSGPESLPTKQAKGICPPVVFPAGLRLFGKFIDLSNGYLNVGRYQRSLLPPSLRRFAPSSTAPVLIPPARLSRPITIIGWQGSGKTRLMFSMLERIQDMYSDIPCLIHDPKGDWVARYYNSETDLIFAPYCHGSCGWKIWEDFQKMPELVSPVLSTAVATYSEGSKEKFWSNKAVEYLESVTHEETLDGALEQLLLKKEGQEGNETFMSFWANITQGLTDIASIEKLESTRRLSMTDFLNHKGRIFLLNSPVASAKQKGVFALFLSAFLLSALSKKDLPEGHLRCCAMIDEALTFSLPHSVETALYNQCRSKGMAIINASQRLPHKAEGESVGWATQAEYTFAFRCSDEETVQRFSRMAGRLVFEESTKSAQYQATSVTAAGVTVGAQERQYDAIPAETFSELKTRQFYLYHEGGLCPARVPSVSDKKSPTPFEFSFDSRADLQEFRSKLL